jgi:hypothetical protein
MKQLFTGKRVLFIGPTTFNYEKEIQKELTLLGAEVTYRSDKPSTGFFMKVLLRMYPNLMWGYCDRIFKKWLENEGPKQCDTVFVVKGEGLSPRFLDIMRARYPDAGFVLYLWDSVKNSPHVTEKFEKFDSLFSFDPVDCRTYERLKYRPLFFLERYRTDQHVPGAGYFFIGTLNGDRSNVIARLIKSINGTATFNYWLFVRSPVELFIRRFFDMSMKQLDASRLIYSPMSSETIRQHFQKSEAIVDVEHPDQKGLTMRTFEILASGKKLITTNNQIIDHDFYDPSRVYVVNRLNPVLDHDFLNTTAKPLPVSFFQKYSLVGWLSEILQSPPISTPLQ